jgi:hypothetical protein
MSLFNIIYYYIITEFILTISYYSFIHFYKYKHYIFNYNLNNIYNDLHTINYLIKSNYHNDFIITNIISYLQKNNNHLEEIIFECIIHNKYKLLKKLLLSSNINHQTISRNFYYKFISLSNLDHKYKSFRILVKYYHDYLYLNSLNQISYNLNSNKCLKYLNKYNIDYSNFTFYNRLNPIIIRNYVNYYKKNNYNISHIIKYYIKNELDININIIKYLFNNLNKKYLKYEKIINDIVEKCDIELIDYILMKLNKLNILKKYIKYIRYTKILNRLNEIINNNCKLDKYYWNIFLINSAGKTLKSFSNADGKLISNKFDINSQSRSLNIIKKNNYSNLINIIDKYNNKINIRSNEIKKLNIIDNDIINYCIKKYL